ncbi:caspase family protein [Actinoplanes sp. LDG1-06]|uniref:Caspase family protein n=1 Tax=Paractinoplanes ovalisporus TaxID=2810368 RepID=A0ABS2AL91_9ACTN|nr:caspase family protein [Actinoplanes ovalisporus]MBM2620590.1 caspase family protein [Actinoplanes ovalisporus]
MRPGRFALVIACDEYENASLQRLSAPGADARALAAALGDPSIGAFTVDTVVNAPHGRVTRRVNEFLSDRKPADLVLIHFSCHGLKDNSGELYLAAADTDPRLLPATALSSTVLSGLVADCRARSLVLLLDCCFGGAFERGFLRRGGAAVDVRDRFDFAGAGRGRVVITASTALQYAFEGPDLSGTGAPGTSVFTGALTEGVVTGAADADGDGYVALGELFDFVDERVRERNPNQTPSKWEFGVQGKLLIARTAAGPTEPAATAGMPPDAGTTIPVPGDPAAGAGVGGPAAEDAVPGRGRSPKTIAVAAGVVLAATATVIGIWRPWMGDSEANGSAPPGGASSSSPTSAAASPEASAAPDKLPAAAANCSEKNRLPLIAADHDPVTAPAVYFSVCMDEVEGKRRGVAKVDSTVPGLRDASVDWQVTLHNCRDAKDARRQPPGGQGEFERWEFDIGQAGSMATALFPLEGPWRTQAIADKFQVTDAAGTKWSLPEDPQGSHRPFVGYTPAECK